MKKRIIGAILLIVLCCSPLFSLVIFGKATLQEVLCGLGIGLAFLGLMCLGIWLMVS
jgi:uncharacterized membrane protein